MIGPRWGAVIAVVTAVVTAAPAAQEVFRASADVVVLAVTVTDSRQHLVPGLEKSDFHVFENGAPQEVTHFSRDPEPIALSILLDTSASMAPKLKAAQEAAVGFTHRLGAHDVAQVIDFDDRANVVQTFTQDRAALERAIRRTEANGSTALYIAIYVALNDLRQIHVQAGEEVRRQAIVLLSDGEDTSSPIDYDQVLDQAKRSGVGVWAIGLKSKTDPSAHEYSGSESDLRKISQATGGRAFVVTDPSQLTAIYQRIADELANQYVLAYTPTDKKHDGTWRSVVVKVDRPETDARTKSGYFAPAVPK
jgi:Ca-activated chloride channel family protein